MTKSFRSGDDILMPDAGKHVFMHCLTCGTNMDVKRNLQRHTRYEGKPIEGQFFDEFTCPHAGEDWHEQIINLKECKKKTPSVFLSALYTTEINAIIKTKHTTLPDEDVLAKLSRYETALKYIAHFSRAALENAQTLHYDMNGVALKALGVKDASEVKYEPGQTPQA